MTSDSIDAALGRLHLTAEIEGNPSRLAKVEALRLAMPGTPLPDEWRAFVELLLSFTGTYSLEQIGDKDLQKFAFAGAFANMCRKAVADGRLPDEVTTFYTRRPKAGALGGIKEVAGAFVFARRDRELNPRLDTEGQLRAASQWAMEALAVWARAGFPEPSLDIPATR